MVKNHPSNNTSTIEKNVTGISKLKNSRLGLFTLESSNQVKG